MGDFFELIVALIIILFGILGTGGRKKKKPPQQRVPGPHPPTERPRAERQEEASAGGFDFQDIERILRQEMGLPQRGQPPAPAPEPVTIEAPETVSYEEFDSYDEAASLEDHTANRPSAWRSGLERVAVTSETLEAAGGASHRRFHARYMDVAAEPQVHTERAAIGPAELRRMIVWREILGPPAGLR